MHCGTSKGECEKIAKLRVGEVVALRSPISSPTSLGEAESAIKEAYDNTFKTIDKLRPNLIKEASVLQDKNTVDAVLSLGLLNKENIMDYIQLAPTLEKVSSDLAKTLLTVRMGLSHIPEQAVKTAMLSLTDVASTLRQLETIVTDTK